MNQSTPDEQRYVVGAAFFLNLFITVVTAVLMFIFTPFLARYMHAPQLATMLYILQVGMVVMIPFSHFEWLMYSKAQFKGIFWTYIFRQGITLVLVLAVYLVKTRVPLNTLVWIYDIGLLTGAIVAYPNVKALVPYSFTVTREWVMRLVHFGKFVFASSLSTLVFRSADQMMLSPILGNISFNSSQNIAIRFINLADLPSQTLGDILFPRTSKYGKNDGSVIKYYYEKTVGASLFVVLPLITMVMLFPKAIIYVLAGPSYYDAIPYLQVISCTSVFLAYLKQFGVIMDSTGRPKVNTLTITFMAAVHVLLLYLFISHFGFIGAGYALVLSHVIGFITTQWMLNRFYGIQFFNAIKYSFKFYPEFLHIVRDRLARRAKA
jgi:O-antigen/teichoic acid export membrane protein